jgi:predicted RNase H-like nuclease (RuvC/YqgF family)
MEEMLSILNEVEDQIQSIRITEDYLTVQKDSELSESQRVQIRNNMKLITEALKKNKQQLADLQERLNASGLQSSALQRTINRLAKEMDEKVELIVKLQADLEQKAVQIGELSAQVEELQADVQELEEIKLVQSVQLSAQEKALNIVHYCFGTKKELKEQNILTGGGLFTKTKAMEGDFNRDYFLAVDKRTLTDIPLFSKKAALKTTHPQNSYRFTKDPDGNLVFEITNRIEFWSMSNYLVIEVR